jgi:tRNA dimethylallyltransferase
LFASKESLAYSKYNLIIKAMSIPKILVLLGPTASGKSDMAVEIALQYGGEIVSADSRQVYAGLDIGTGKIMMLEMRGVPHHLLDVVTDPNKQYSVAHFKRDAEKAIDGILSRGKLPILCGGTGLYIQAIVDNVLTPEIVPNTALREELASKTADELFRMLQKLDSKRAETVDSKNPRRLIRAIEIAKSLGAVPKLPERSPKYDSLQIGIQTDKETLRARIEIRLGKRLAEGMIEEVAELHEKGLSFERMDELGLEYRYVAKYLQEKITREEMKKELATKIRQYARRQMTWFKRDKRILWFPLDKKPDIFAKIEEFLGA